MFWLRWLRFSHHVVECSERFEFLVFFAGKQKTQTLKTLRTLKTHEIPDCVCFYSRCFLYHYNIEKLLYQKY